MNKDEKVQPEEMVKNETRKEEKGKKNKSNKEIERLKNENLALNEKILRISADAQNMKKRLEEEISRLQKYEGLELAKELLPTIDNFERAILLDDTNLNDELSKSSKFTKSKRNQRN